MFPFRGILTSIYQLPLNMFPGPPLTVKVHLPTKCPACILLTTQLAQSHKVCSLESMLYGARKTGILA